MTSKEIKKAPVLSDTAIPTWSGFVYQGKIALLHCLQVINNESRQIVERYSLQLDSLDDFAILGVYDSPKSFHQVKAYKSGALSSYTEAFNKQQALQSKCSCAKFYFHITANMKVATIENLELSYDPVKLYEYSLKEGVTRKYCPLNDVDNQIKERLKIYFTKKYLSEEFRQSSEYLIKCCRFLDQIIQSKVIEIHAAVHGGESARRAASAMTIPFNELLEILDGDLNDKEVGEDYYYWVLKQDLGRYYEDFCIEEDLLLEDRNKLSRYMVQLNSLDIHELKKFIKSIYPHREIRLNSLTEYKDDSFDKEGIQLAFFTILNQLKEVKTDKQFVWIGSCGSSYGSTAISHGSSHASRICNRIINNSLDLDVSVGYEVDSLITTDIECSSILNQSNNVLTHEIGDKDKHNRITQWKEISLVKLEDAKDKIND